MEQYSQFELANPLSSKKFAKKMYQAIVGWVIAFAVIAFLGLIVLLQATNGDSSKGTLLHVLGIIGLALGVIFAVAIVLNAVYIKAYIRRYYYDAGDHFITIKKGVFAPAEIHVQYAKIQDVYVDQDIVDRMLGLYDVHIASATVTSGIEAHIDGVNKDVAENIKSTFLSRITTYTPNQTPPGAASIAANVAADAPATDPSQEISSRTYPPSAKYLLISIMTSIITSILAILIFAATIENQAGITVSPAYIFGIIIVLLLFSTISSVIWFKNYYFIFDRGMVVLRTKIISTNETHVPYQTIQDVVMNQGILNRMFGLATVTVQNATQSVVGRNGAVSPTGITLIAQPVAKAQELVEIIRGIIQKSHGSATGL